jgi:hypothetical protein
MPSKPRVRRSGPYTDARPDTYAGRWIARTNGEPTLYVAFTDGLEGHRRALALPQVEIVGARFSEARLEAIQDAIAAGDPPVEWSMLSLDVVNNVVEVGANGPGSEDEVRALLRARYGDAVRLKWGVWVVAT